MAGSGATARTETFGYDLLNRMTSTALTVGTSTAAVRTLGYAYDRLGNVTGRDSSTETDLESTVYGAGRAGPNALTTATYGTGTAVKHHTLTYDAGGRVIEHMRPGDDPARYIAWNGRGLAQTITVGDSAADSAPEARDRFAYGPDGRRYHRQTTWDADPADAVTDLKTEHTFYVGSFEERTLDGHATYASVQKTRVSAGVLHVRKVRTAPANGAETAFEYLHRDHLGSVEKVTDANGAELLVLSYDPFGSRRKSDWTRRLTDPEHGALIDALKLRTSEGFSGHEHLERTGFVHMGGRVYDPELMRFLSPDPVVTRPTSSQSWNSYGYAMNSPLSYVDPYGRTFAPVESGCSVFISSCNPGGHGGGFSRITQTLYSTIQEIWAGFFVVHIPVPGPSLGGYPGDYGGFGFGLPSYWSSIPVPLPFVVEGPTRTVERQVASTEPTPADTPMEAPITDEQRKYARQGMLEEFWTSRKESGDPIADLALEVIEDRPFARGWLANAVLRDVARREGIDIDLKDVQIRIMRTHVEVTDLDKDGLLTPEQITDYHHDVFERFELPPYAFGGTPVFGLPVEADPTAPTWCQACPEE